MTNIHKIQRSPKVLVKTPKMSFVCFWVIWIFSFKWRQPKEKKLCKTFYFLSFCLQATAVLLFSSWRSQLVLLSNAVAQVSESRHMKRGQRSDSVCHLGWRGQGGHVLTVLNKHVCYWRTWEVIRSQPHRDQAVHSTSKNPHDVASSGAWKLCDRRWKMTCGCRLCEPWNVCSHRNRLMGFFCSLKYIKVHILSVYFSLFHNTSCR